MVVEGVSSSGELSDSRNDLTVGGLVEDIESRGEAGPEAGPLGCNIACASLNDEDECSEERELHLVLSFDTRANVSILCKLEAEAL